MNHPDEPVAVSTALPGDLQPKPEKIISIVVSDQENEPAGILEKWDSEAWFYAPAEDLKELN